MVRECVIRVTVQIGPEQLLSARKSLVIHQVLDIALQQMYSTMEATTNQSTAVLTTTGGVVLGLVFQVGNVAIVEDEVMGSKDLALFQPNEDGVVIVPQVPKGSDYMVQTRVEAFKPSSNIASRCIVSTWGWWRRDQGIATTGLGSGLGRAAVLGHRARPSQYRRYTDVLSSTEKTSGTVTRVQEYTEDT